MTVTNESKGFRSWERTRKAENVYLAFALWHTQVKFTIHLGIVHIVHVYVAYGRQSKGQWRVSIQWLKTYMYMNRAVSCGLWYTRGYTQVPLQFHLHTFLYSP